VPVGDHAEGLGLAELEVVAIAGVLELVVVRSEEFV
jgi:hypothetical protein